MLSAIIEVADSGRGLRATFASLTAAATDGFVREVIVADRAGSSEVATIAEEAGARVVSAGAASLAEACATARQSWLLLLTSGARLETGWEQAAWRHVNDHGDRAGWFRLTVRARGFGARVEEERANLAARLLGRLRAEHGLLIARRLYDDHVECGVAIVSLPFPARPLRRLDARILVEPP